jgi:UDP-N-acetylglucosamine--N-acetylmuramyl-(pentapeptide) pyrophosphoryl-undecaprenol N-acetylglucosamine transferase
MLGKKAKKICVAFEGMDKYFDKEKIVLTGNPVRENIVKNSMSKSDGLKAFGLSEAKKTVFITGGSLGARAINEGIAAMLDDLVNHDVQLIWQVGKVYLEACKGYESKAPALIKVMDFIPNMDAAYAAADVIVSRAGGTISELAIIGKPAILLPSPNVAEDHQTVNVRSLVEKEAAILVKDADAKEKLVPEILSLLSDSVKQASLSKNIKAMARPEAARSIAEEVLKLVK